MLDFRFRAKRKDNNEWVKGYYWSQTNNACFKEDMTEKYYIRVQLNHDWNLVEQVDYEIDPVTLGLSTNSFDQYNNEIFEGDIILYQTENSIFASALLFSENKKDEDQFASFHIEENTTFDYSEEYADEDNLPYMEVIGNIYDTPDMVK